MTASFTQWIVFGRCFSLLLALFSLPVTAQITRYVSTTGTNNTPATATSWATSTTDLQGAINSLTATGGQVWVAQGIYKPTTGYDRNASFSMRNGVSVYGNFMGNEASIAQRPLLSVTSPSNTTLSGDVGIPGNPTDNSFHIVNNPPGLNNSALLDGFVLFEGNTSGIFPDYYGGGIYNNGSGAGNSCSPRIVNCFFVNNSATEGGALYNNGNGGGSCNAVIINCVFQNNTATSFGGAVENDGGNGGSNNSEFINCIFRNNSVPGNSGGAVYNFGAVGNSNPRFVNCFFLDNTAASGGALFNDGSNGGTSNPQLINGSFLGNTATAGGALYSYVNGAGTSQPQLTNCVLFNNGGTSTLVNSSANTVLARYSLFEPSVTGYTSVTGNLTTSTTPFVSTTSAQIAICSPAVNTGDPASTTTTTAATDLSGNPRFFNGTRIDMGAYEVQTHPNVAIISQPAASSLGCVGSTITTFVSTSGTATGFQWYRSGTAVSEQTSATLTLPNVQTSNAGNYVVGVTGNCNSVTSTVFSLSVQPVPSRLYVRASATGTNTGLNWSNAFIDLQSALNYTCRSSLSEIWVANGLYKPTSGTARTVSFAMLPNVAIYGGFLGNETALIGRPSAPSGTTLSGNIGDLATAADNSYHVFNNYSNPGLTATAILDNFVVTSGNANGSFPYTLGGAMFNNGSGSGRVCSPTIRNCLFINNLATSGGAVYNNGSTGGSSSPAFVNCAFLDNFATTDGGAVYNLGYAGNSSPAFTNCSFQNNAAANYGGAMVSDGGGSGAANPQLRNCVLFSNGGSSTFFSISATVAASYSFFEPTVTGYTNVTGNLTSSISPFVSASGVQLKNGSPPIDAGDPATTSALVGITDLLGNPRFFNGGRIDMGAVELPDTLEIYTLVDGNWSSPAIWSVARLPQSGERIRLKHSVTIPASFQAQGGTLIYDPASKLIYGAGGKLSVAPQ